MEMRISGTSDRLFVESEKVLQVAKLNANGFFSHLLRLPPRRCLDLLRIAAGVHIADRIVKRVKRKENEEGTRRIHLKFEVKEPDFWASPDVQPLLVEILTFLTDDDWSVDFEIPRRLGDHGYQDFLDLPRPFAPEHAALYSGGLDSAAGLANRLLEGDNNFILITVGHRSGLHARVAQQIAALEQIVESQCRPRVQLLHSTLTTALQGGKAKRMRLQERTQRSRAFFFCSAAVVAADAYGLRAVEMFENGVGSINLPLMTGMLGSALSTRGAHPTFLGDMSRLASLVTESQTKFVLPFEAKTKGEMLGNLQSIEGMSPWLQQSHSCVHTAIRESDKTHCGVCPACIERRQAFAVAGMEEDTGQYVVDIFADKPGIGEAADYFNLYRFESLSRIQEADSYGRRLTNHLRMTGAPDARDDAIRELHQRHCHEVFRTFGSPFATTEERGAA